MEVKIGKYLVVIKCFQLLFIHLLSAGIVESNKNNNAVITQLGNERPERSPLINVTSLLLDIPTTRKTISQSGNFTLIYRYMKKKTEKQITYFL